MRIDVDVVRVDDIAVGYRHAGSGRSGVPWVFVHGLGEDSASWAAQLSVIGETRPAFAVDVRGHGRTRLGRADGTLRQLADDLLGFLRTVGPSVCVGFSMGGAVVLAAAAREPELVEHVVPVCTSSVVGRRAAERFRTRADGIEAGGAEFARASLSENLTANVPDRPPAGWAEQLASRLAAIGDGKGYANGARAMASMHEDPLTPRLAGVRAPVDVFVGERDTSCPWRAGEIIAGAVSDGRCHLLPGVGHFVNIERPDVLTGALTSLR
ncbi:alpha/beta fold hydrolase [Actinomadura chibensis]|uniref:Alpha/beta fold hydrolase n=1 Tax=Actinomadura chibensis TaxID=392828 RepID=A0A5D0NI34_9ACTN|nr:alpha/beta hydrolase [Actinomadura chibensis]TYB44004.1 alpha/beta fold hydrolase [Actinomadura chibensis]